MSAPVDVLAVLDRAVLAITMTSTLRDKSKPARELREARAAVAELIEADREYDAAVYALYRTKGVEEAHVAHRKLADAKARRSAALVSIGSTK